VKARVSAYEISRIVLEQSMRARVGHIGSALSISGILAALYDGGLRAGAPDDPDRDRFILSKGHAALALYAALHLRGWLTADELDTYCADNTLLGVHPDSELIGVDFSTGSLGHGLSIGVGAALGALFRDLPPLTALTLVTGVLAISPLRTVAVAEGRALVPALIGLTRLELVFGVVLAGALLAS